MNFWKELPARVSLLLEQAGQDFGYALRQVRRNPGFAAMVIGILAVGLGGTTAIFSAVNALVLKPLPYEQPGQLVRLFEAPEPGRQNQVSAGVFLDWQKQSVSFQEIAAFNGTSVNMTGTGEAERVNGLRMTASGLQLLRVQAALGRTFAADEDQPGRDKVVVLTSQFWRRRFGGENNVVGRVVRLNDEPYTVIGVLPEKSLPFESQEFVIPFVFQPEWKEQRGTHRLGVLARLKQGVSREQAQVELDAVVQRNKSLFPNWKQSWTVTVVPMNEQLVQEIKPTLWILLGAVSLVLLIGCINVANLLLAKASTREKEIAVRGALGASRGRIVRQVLAESVLFSTMGVGLGLLIAYWSVGFIRQIFGTMNVARAHDISVDGFALGLAVTASLVSGIGFGLAPAIQAARQNIEEALRASSRGASAGRNRLRGALIVGEVALALMLLAGAGLVLHSFARMINVQPGFNAERMLTAQMSLSNERYPDNARRVAFYHQILERAAAMPGVEAAGIAQTLPLRGGSPDRFFRIVGRANHREPGYGADYDFCTADFLRAMGVPLLRGRFYTASEVANDSRVALINETMAKQYFEGEEPIGRKIEVDNQAWEIVGIVGDVRMRSLVRPSEPMVYRPQSPTDPWRNANLVLRTKGEPELYAKSVRQIIREIDPAQPVANVMTMAQVVERSLLEQRLALSFLGGFAGVALLLAAVGLYGVIAYTVMHRTREFGIRMALGAQRSDVLGLVLRHGMGLVAIGLGIGISGALGLARFLKTLLYEIEPHDPLTLSLVSAALLGVALVASWLPARRASKVNPMEALRAD